MTTFRDFLYESSISSKSTRDILNIITTVIRGGVLPPGHPLSLNLDTLAFSSYTVPNFVESDNTF